jgi:hypothetical protein
MIDREHQKAQELAARAAAALRSGRAERARELYGLAAEHEAEALANVPADKPRTRGIIGASLAALHFKAEDFRAAERVAKRLLADEELSADARERLGDILIESQHARIRAREGIVRRAYGGIKRLTLRRKARESAQSPRPVHLR